MIVVCLNIFNSLKLLPRTLRTIKGSVDKIVAVDGAYRDYPHTKPYSTDGPVEYLKKEGIEVIEVAEAWEDQLEKRTAYFLGEDGDIYFIIDADEVLAKDFDKAEIEGMTEDVGWITYINPLYANRPYLEPRLFRFKTGMHYAGRHDWIYDGQGRLMASHRSMGESYKHKIFKYILYNTRPRDKSKDKSTYRIKRNRIELAFLDENAVYHKESKLIPNPKSAPDMRGQKTYQAPIIENPVIVSIIIPCIRNRGYLIEAIGSAITQMTGTEVIVVSDGDKNTVERVVREFTQVKYVYQEHGGLSKAVNTGVKLAKGKYIKILPDDDKLMPDCLKNLVEGLETAKADWIHANAWIVTQEGKKYSNDSIHIPRRTLPTLKDMLSHNHINGVSPLYKKSCWDKCGGWDESIWTGEELDWHLKLLKYGCKIAYVNKTVVMYRKHKQRKSFRKTKKYFLARVRVIKRIRRRYR